MRLTVLFFLFLVPILVRAQADTKLHQAFYPPADKTDRFLFYSVLEGCYEDGLSNKDVDQILMKKEDQYYFHFIYACPVCTSVIWALQVYRNRPDKFYSLKNPASTFAAGLPEATEKQLFSENPRQRLAAINTLVKGWVERRMSNERLTPTERKALLAELQKKRGQGMTNLKIYRREESMGSKNGVSRYAPAYIDVEECAVCNGAIGQPMKLPGEK